MRTSNLILTVLAALLAIAVIVSVTAAARGGSAGTADVALAGVRAERSYDAVPLRHLRVAGPIRVILSAGVPDVRVEADEALLDHLADADPAADVLAIEVPRGVRLASGEEVVAHVTTPTLERLSLSGTASVTSPAALPFASNRVETSGSCRVDLRYADAESVELAASGSAEVELRGLARALTAEFSGSGDLDAGELVASVVRVRSSGSASSVVHADSLLAVESSGSGEVRYRGNPRVAFDNSGSGSLRAL